MRRSAYGERDYAFGQLILTLHSAIGLTQAGLSAHLGISKRAVGSGKQEAVIPRPHDLLAPLSPVALSPRAGTPGAHAAAKPAASPRVDLVEALDVSHFTGREVEGTAIGHGG